MRKGLAFHPLRRAPELRTQYSLGYAPDKKNVQTGYRTIKLTAKRKELVVQTRGGYYADE